MSRRKKKQSVETEPNKTDKVESPVRNDTTNETAEKAKTTKDPTKTTKTAKDNNTTQNGTTKKTGPTTTTGKQKALHQNGKPVVKPTRPKPGVKPTATVPGKKPAIKPTTAPVKPNMTKPKPGPSVVKVNRPAEQVKWKEPRPTQDEFVFSGTQLRVEKDSCLAKNSIQDGNSAFGMLEVRKDMKVEWTIKIAQGAQVAVGVMQTDDSLKKNDTKYRKLLNNIFCTDRLGYGYFGKDGGVMKGGKYRKYGASFKAGDIVTVVLDMAINQLEFKKDNKSQGVAFSNIPTGCYRLAVMLPKKMHKVVIQSVQLWDVDKSNV